MPDEPGAGRASGGVDAEGDQEDVGADPDGFEDPPVDASAEKGVHHAGDHVRNEPDGDPGRHVENKNAERVSGKTSHERRRVDERMALLHSEIEAKDALAIGGHGDGEVYARNYLVSRNTLETGGACPRAAPSRVMPRKAMHISSVVCSPQETGFGWNFGFCKLLYALSYVASGVSFVPYGIVSGSL